MSFNAIRKATHRPPKMMRWTAEPMRTPIHRLRPLIPLTRTSPAMARITVKRLTNQVALPTTQTAQPSASLGTAKTAKKLAISIAMSTTKVRKAQPITAPTE